MPEETPLAEQADDKLLFGASDRVELISTVMLSLAAIFTAWAAFQSAKWSGEQATNFSKAGASRTESTRWDTQAGQQIGIDVAVFTSWLDAFNADRNAGLIEYGPGDLYEPNDGTVSGFLYERMRDEFRPAMEAWLVEFAADQDAAPATPFDMEEYVVEAALEADRLKAEAEAFATAAGEANQNSDDYVLTAVAFALVLFFGGVSSKLSNQRNRWLALIVGVALFVGATWTLLSLPKILPF